MQIKQFTYRSEQGFHENIAIDLVKNAAKFKSEITISYNKKQVNLKSIMGVMSLGIEQGGEIEITVDGQDEEEAFATILSMMEVYELI